MNKFQLIVNESHTEGFKLVMQTNDAKVMEIYKELADKLIAKIEKITISIGESTTYE